MKHPILLVFMLAATTTTASASPIYPTFGTGFFGGGGAGLNSGTTTSGRLDSTVTFDGPLTGVLTFWHSNEDGWPIDFDGWSAGILRDTFQTYPLTGLTYMRTTLTVTGVTAIGFARFVEPMASVIRVRDFDYVPTTPPIPTPEPTTMALVGLGLLAGVRIRFRR